MDAGWEELERMAMAASANDAQIADECPPPETIERWEQLFGYSHMEAVRLIGDQRADGKSLILPCVYPLLTASQSPASASPTTTGL
jgi:hypothetical protein